MRQPLKVAIVGPCCAGKTTLAAALRERGYEASPLAQEHSFAPGMWEKMAHPDALVYLDVTYEVAQHRRFMNWTPADMAEEQRRLRHAREHCDLYLHTDELTVEQVRKTVLDFLRVRNAP